MKKKPALSMVPAIAMLVQIPILSTPTYFFFKHSEWQDVLVCRKYVPMDTS